MLLAGAFRVNTRFAEPGVRCVAEDSGAAFVFERGAALPGGELEIADPAAARQPKSAT